MRAVDLTEMQAAEAAAQAAGWTEAGLLDRAGRQLGMALGRFFPTPGTCVGYLGKGHNAGDALVALRVLRDRFGWQVAIRAGFATTDCSPLTRAVWHDLGLTALNAMPAWRELEGPLVLLDGLLGTGSQGALRPPLSELAAEMEWLRQNAGARVAAVDLPSGVDADSGTSWPGHVTADVTFMIGNAKMGLVTAQAANATGALALVPVDALTAAGTSELALIAPQSVTWGKAPRPFDFHKGMAGRVAVIAGSAHYSGAAVLAATGALQGGAGLITLYVPASAAAMIAAKCPPEIIIRSYASLPDALDDSCDARVIGCGLEEVDAATMRELLERLAKSPVPAVVDATALNLIARYDCLGLLTEQHVVTPHPGEFARLAPDLADLPREAAAHAFTGRSPATLLLKGCRTLVTRRGQPLWCNATGHPGMATGGQGDLLAGVIGARLAAGDPTWQAAALAAWLCGRAAEIALTTTASADSLTPSACAKELGRAFHDWRTARR